MKPKSVRRNALRQVRPIWSYIDSQVALEGKAVFPGSIFPTRPSDENRLEQIEGIFNDWGIQVVWHDESIEELRKRMNDG